MKKFSRLPIWWQLFIGLVSCFLFSLLVIGASFFIDLKESEKNNWAYLQEINSQWKMEIETITANLDYMKYLPLIDSNVMFNLRTSSEHQSSKQQFSSKTYMNGLLEDICGISPFVLRITIAAENGNIYGNFVEDSQAQIAQARSHIIYSQTGYKNEEYITDVYEGEINLLPYKLLTIAFSMYTVESNEKLATIYIDLDFEEVKKNFLALPQDELKYYLLNKNGVIYQSSNSVNEQTPPIEELIKISQQPNGQKSLKINGTVHNVHVIRIEKLDWYLVQCMEQSDFITKSMNSILFFCVWVLLVFAFLLFGGIQLINRITKPVRAFSDVLSQVTLHKKQKPQYVQMQEDVPEEIRDMINGYNSLVTRIEENIILAYQNELSQKKTELQMLQYQINPHFLYNTLNIVSSLAKLNGINEISEITESLSHIFHYNVKGGQIVQLNDELENLRYYVKIQKLRFPEKFDVTYDIEPDIQKYTILKFILQPLMENAIEHGIIPCKRKGHIRVSAHTVSEHIAEISFYDNGVGIEKETLQTLIQDLNEEARHIQRKKTSGIGIMNVHRRINNYYGAQFGLSIVSEQGQYTCIQIRFPAINKEE